MAISHIAVLAGALVVLLCLPCALTALIRSDDARARRRAFVRRGKIDAPALVLLDAGTWPDRCVQPGPGLDQIAADLRRIDRQRRSGPATGSELWLDAMVRAYDHRLELACDSLGVSQHLHQLGGMDRDIERVRVQGRLQDSGLDLR